MRPIDADSLKPDMIHEYNTFPAAPQYGTLQRVLGVSMEQIAKAPTIEPKHGEWKHLGGDEWLCPECGHVIWTEGSWEHPLERGKFYCENCGARMKGKDNE